MELSNEEVDFEELLPILIVNQQVCFPNNSIHQHLMIESSCLILHLQRQQVESLPHGGSHPSRFPNLPRNYEAGYVCLFKDYFAANPIYPASIFQ